MSYAGLYGPSETCKHDRYWKNCTWCNGDVERFARHIQRARRPTGRHGSDGVHPRQPARQPRRLRVLTQGPEMSRAGSDVIEQASINDMIEQLHALGYYCIETEITPGWVVVVVWRKYHRDERWSRGARTLTEAMRRTVGQAEVMDKEHVERNADVEEREHEHVIEQFGEYHRGR